MSDSKGGTQQIYAPDGVTLLKDYLNGKALAPIGTLTWAEIAALNAATYSGRQVICSDYPSIWQSNGARFVRLTSVTVYAAAAAAGLSTAITGPGGDVKAPGFTSPSIPAGMLNTGDTVFAETQWVFAGAAGTRRPNLEFGTTDDLTGTTLALASAYSSAFAQALIGGKFVVTGPTAQVVITPTANAGNYGASGAGLVTGAYDTANRIYFVASCTMAGAADTGVLTGMTVRIE